MGSLNIQGKHLGLDRSITQRIFLLVNLLVVLMISSAGCSIFQSKEIFDFPEVGFSLELPDSWHAYRIESAYWEGLTNPPDSDSGDVVVESGPMIIIHHPESTPEDPRQEIPIMVMTIPQWEAMVAGDWHIGAAPVLPMELGRNSRYVFAVPARYNYAFHEGWEEVEEILRDQNINLSEPDQP